MKTLVNRLTLIALAIFCVAAMMLNTFAAVAGFDPIDPCSSANGTYCVYCKTENLVTDVYNQYTGNEIVEATAAVCKRVEKFRQRTHCTNCKRIHEEIYTWEIVQHPNRYYDEKTGEYYCNACGFRGKP